MRRSYAEQSHEHDAKDLEKPTLVTQWLGNAGRFAQHMPHFQVRQSQVEMAEKIHDTIVHRQVLIAEAGTGTGKTFAYLVPAFLESAKTLISTGSKTLQDQLFHRDIPYVRAVLKRPLHVALLKGRSNYVCHFRLELSENESSQLPHTIQGLLPQIRAFSEYSHSGDRAELTEIPDDHSIWPHVTSTRDNCLGHECPAKESCFVLKARREALQADVIVTNHHLLLADLKLRDESLSELLPHCDTVIIDEAHHLPELASEFFGESLSSGQWLELSKDILVSALLEAHDALELIKHTQNIQRTLEHVEHQLERLFPYSGRFACSDMEAPELLEALKHFSQHIQPWLLYLEEAAPRSASFSQLHKRGEALYALLSHWMSTYPDSTAQPIQPFVHWLEKRHRSWRLVLTPLNIGEQFHARLNLSSDADENEDKHDQAAPVNQAWIFTSATLAMAQDFSLYQDALGLSSLPHKRLHTQAWESPFDYPKQALLYLPPHLPEPNHPDHPTQLIDTVWPLLLASHGRALLLFTSFKAMEQAWQCFHQKLENHHPPLEWLPMMQGQSSKADLLDQFSRHPHPVLFGSHSFWEGIDLPGRKLSLLIIDRIPFSPPNDPVTAARLRWIEHQGHDAFTRYQLPQAALTLKQGVGRLIRREQDEGVVVLGDPRLRRKHYGRRILGSLPPMKISIHAEDVIAFLSKL